MCSVITQVYLGRQGVFELLTLDEFMLQALRTNDAQAFNTAVENLKDHHSLGLSAIALACDGVTTISEVMRVAEDLEDAKGR